MSTFLSLVKTPLFILKWHQRRAFIKYVKRIRGRVLDVGCGWQPYRELLECDRYWGVELGPEVRPDVRANVAQLPFRDEVFDGLVCTEVIEHVPDPQAVLDDISRVLAQDGAAYLTAPMSWCLHYQPYDYFRFTNWGLEMLAERAGLRVVTCERIGGVFSLIGVRLSDVLAHRVERLFLFFGKGVGERMGALAALSVSIPFWILGLLLDRFDERDAIGWAVLLEKSQNERGD